MSIKASREEASRAGRVPLALTDRGVFFVPGRRNRDGCGQHARMGPR